MLSNVRCRLQQRSPQTGLALLDNLHRSYRGCRSLMNNEDTVVPAASSAAPSFADVAEQRAQSSEQRTGSMISSSDTETPERLSTGSFQPRLVKLTSDAFLQVSPCGLGTLCRAGRTKQIEHAIESTCIVRKAARRCRDARHLQELKPLLQRTPRL